MPNTEILTERRSDTRTQHTHDLNKRGIRQQQEQQYEDDDPESLSISIHKTTDNAHTF